MIVSILLVFVLVNITVAEEGSGEETMITVELVTHRTFDPENNEANLKILKDTIDEFSQTEGIHYPSDQINQHSRDHGGKFAAIFEIGDDATCEEVQRFVDKAAKYSKEVDYALLKCPGEKPLILFH